MKDKKTPNDDLFDFLLTKFKEIIAQTTGIKIKQRDEKKLFSSIMLRMNELHFPTPLVYYQKIKSNGRKSEQEIIKLICSIVNKESYFFRDKGHFDVLKSEIFPTLIKEKSQQRTLRIWSAGCSSGEEPYSIAMLLFSLLPNWRNWDLLILGTDLCKDMIDKAQSGLYGEMSFRTINNGDRNRFFSKQPNGHWLIAPFLRQNVIFAQNNLLTDIFPNEFSLIHHMDLIICRNVFIYFQQDAITKVVDKFNRTLNKGGYLLTGHGELQGFPLLPFKGQLLKGALIYQKVV